MPEFHYVCYVCGVTSFSGLYVVDINNEGFLEGRYMITIRKNRLDIKKQTKQQQQQITKIHRHT
jgi:hypothetical protein